MRRSAVSNSFIVEQKSLLAVLASMQPICTKRTTLDATSTILFNVGHRELVLKSTDLEISLQASYLLKESTILHPRSFLVSGRRIFELVKELDGDITCTIEEAQLTLQSGFVHLALHIKSADEFPPFPERIENRMQLDAAFLLSMINRVAFVIPQNNANTALNGLFLEINNNEFKMTATDGHCLAQVRSDRYSLPETSSWLLPRRAVFEVKKIVESVPKEAPIFLGTCANQLVFSGDSFNFFTRLLSDTFPQYEGILKREQFTPAFLDRSHFSGSAVDVRFYAPYLLNGIQTFAEDAVRLYLHNNTKPIIFESNIDRYSVLYLVMPVASTSVHGR